MLDERETKTLWLSAGILFVAGLLLLAYTFVFPKVAEANTYFVDEVLGIDVSSGDIDVSEWVGENEAFVYLKIESQATGGAEQRGWFYPAGETGTGGFIGQHEMTAGANVFTLMDSGGGGTRYVWAQTNDEGVFTFGINTDGIDITLKGYSINEAGGASEPMDLYFGTIIFLLVTFFLVWLFRTKDRRN